MIVMICGGFCGGLLWVAVGLIEWVAVMICSGFCGGLRWVCGGSD